MRGADARPLGRSGLDACLIKLARGAGGRRKTLDLITLPFSSATDGRERRCFARAREPLDSLDVVGRTEDILYHASLCPVEMLVMIGNGDGLRTRKNRLDVVLSLTHPAENFMFRFDGFGGGELAARNALRPLDYLKFSGSHAGIKISAHLGMGDLAHAPAKSIADERTFVHNRLALEVLVAGKGERFSNTLKRVNGFLLVLTPFLCGPNNGLGLVPKVCRQLRVGGHAFSRRKNLFAVARRVRGDLGSLLSRAARAFEVLANLLAAGTGGVKVFLRIAPNLGGAAPPGRDFITELADPISQLGLIDGRRKLLR